LDVSGRALLIDRRRSEKAASMAKRTSPPQDQGQPKPVALPAAAQVLKAHMQELARQFISRRRQLGVELLEAARLLAEARVFICMGSGSSSWR
jgi:hypothetical protein